MFTRVLFPNDFSAHADAVLACLPDLKSAGLREVVLLSVICASVVLPVQDERARQYRSPEQLAAFDRHDTERLEALCRALRSYGLQARTLLRHGIPP